MSETADQKPAGLLPGDELGRSWLQANWGDITDATSAEKVIGTLITVDEEGQLSVLGSALVIHAGDEHALCLGAAHSFDEVKRLQRTRSARGYAGVPLDFLPHGPEYIEVGTIQVLFLIDNEPLLCSVGQYNSIAGYDVAAFTVHAPAGKKPFFSNLAIDLSEPRVGDRVGVVAHDLHVEPQPLHEDGLPRGALRRKLDLRLGVVTEVMRGPTGLPGQSFIFRTTIPVTGGMSGSPVIVDNGGKGAVIVRGVISSDLSEEGAFTNFLIPGRSSASCLWPAMGLAVDAETSSDSPGPMFLGEMIDRGAFDNRSDGVTVLVRQPADQTEVLYVDERAQPPERFLLRTTGHPGRTPGKP